MGDGAKKGVLMKKMVAEVEVKPCPWCKKTPELIMPINDTENSGETWLWCIRCVNPECKMHPETPHIAIRKTTKENFGRILEKLDKLANTWNEGNELKAEFKKVIDLSPLRNRMEKDNWRSIYKPGVQIVNFS